MLRRNRMVRTNAETHRDITLFSRKFMIGRSWGEACDGDGRMRPLIRPLMISKSWERIVRPAHLPKFTGELPRTVCPKGGNDIERLESHTSVLAVLSVDAEQLVVRRKSADSYTQLKPAF